MFVGLLNKWLGVPYLSNSHDFAKNKKKDNKPFVCHTLRRNSIEKANNCNNKNFCNASTSNSIEQVIDEDGLDCGENEDEFLETSTSFLNITDEKFYITNEEEKSLNSLKLKRNKEIAKKFEIEDDLMRKSVYLDADGFDKKKTNVLGDNFNQSIYEDALDKIENNCVNFLIEVEKSDIDKQKIFFSEIKLSDSLFKSKENLNLLLNATSTFANKISKVNLSPHFSRKESNVKICRVFDTKNYEFINIENIQFKNLTISDNFAFNFINDNYFLSFSYPEVNNFSIELHTLEIQEINYFLNSTFTSIKSTCDANIIFHNKTSINTFSYLSAFRYKNKSESNLYFKPIEKQPNFSSLNKNLSNSLEDRKFCNNLELEDLNKTNLFLWSSSEVNLLTLNYQESNQTNNININSGYLPSNFSHLKTKLLNLSNNDESVINEFSTSSGSDFEYAN